MQSTSSAMINFWCSETELSNFNSKTSFISPMEHQAGSFLANNMSAYLILLFLQISVKHMLSVSVLCFCKYPVHALQCTQVVKCMHFFASYTLLDICCLLLKLQKVSKENYFYRERISLTQPQKQPPPGFLTLADNGKWHGISSRARSYSVPQVLQLRASRTEVRT